MVSHWMVGDLNPLGLCLVAMGPTLGANFESWVFSFPSQSDLKHWAHRIEDTDSLYVDLCYYLFHSPL